MMKLWRGFEDPPCGGGMGASGQGFPCTHGPGSILGRVDDCWPCLWVREGSGAAQLSRNDSGGKGGRPPLAPLTSHPSSGQPSA